MATQADTVNPFNLSYYQLISFKAWRDLATRRAARKSKFIGKALKREQEKDQYYVYINNFIDRQKEQQGTYSITNEEYDFVSEYESCDEEEEDFTIPM